jgi:hypothetical protein
MKQLLFRLSLLGSLGGAIATAAPAGPATVIGHEVTKLEALYTDGFASSDASTRHVAFGPLFDTDRQDAVAFFSLGGVDATNVHFECIAIFAKGQERDMPKVGGPKERPFHLVTTAMVGSRGTRTLIGRPPESAKAKLSCRACVGQKEMQRAARPSRSR